MPMQMASPPGPMSVADVYDLAASIGKEFEKIIDGYGPETITQLMPRVIYALEHLEILSNRNEKENDELTELQYAVERLQADKSAKAEERDKYEKVPVRSARRRHCHWQSGTGTDYQTHCH